MLYLNIYVCISISKWSSGCNGANGGYVCICIYCTFGYMYMYLYLNGARDLMAPMAGMYVFVCTCVYVCVYMHTSIDIMELMGMYVSV